MRTRQRFSTSKEPGGNRHSELEMTEVKTQKWTQPHSISALTLMLCTRAVGSSPPAVTGAKRTPLCVRENNQPRAWRLFSEGPASSEFGANPDKSLS